MENQIILTAVNFDLSALHREELLAKFDRVLRHQNRVVRLRIFLEGDYTHHTKISYTARATIELRGEEIFVSSADEHLSAAVHELVDKIERGLNESLHRKASLRHNSPKQGVSGEMDKELAS